MLADQADVSAFLRVRAISAFLAAIENYPTSAFVYQVAEAHCNLAQVLCQHGVGMESDFQEIYLKRALDSYEMASKFFTAERHPIRWAYIQMCMGGIFATHAQIAITEIAANDYAEATERFGAAAKIFHSSNETEYAEFCDAGIKKINELKEKSHAAGGRP